MEAFTLTKHFRQLLLTMVVAIAAGIFTSAFAGPEVLPSAKDKNPIVEIPTCKTTWYFTISGGADFDLGATDINKSRTQSIIPGFVTAFIKQHDFNDAFDDVGYHVQGELGFAVGNYWEFFGLFKWEHVDASGRTSGSHVLISVPRVIIADIPFGSEFGDYNSYGFEFGARFFFLSRQARFRPYISVSGGPTEADAIDITTFTDFSSIGGPSNVKLFHGRYLSDTLIGTGAAMLGAEYAINCHVSIGVEGGIRYESPLDDDDRTFEHRSVLGIVPLGFLRSVNNGVGDRLVVPASGYVKLRW
ncbi:MAG TPA: hypothetical protein VH170_01605 [Chthoniobacterales bacterium]|nr:hypothetical protein [Chthoniobacterales bacterium]